MSGIDNSESAAPKRSFGKIIWFFARIALAVGIIYWLISRKGGKITNISIAWQWVLLAVFCYATALTIGCCRWWVLLRLQGVKVGFKETLSLFMQGIFFSLVIPGGAIGGDVYKAGALATKLPKGSGRLEAVFTILMDRVIGMVALFGLAIAVSLASINYIRQFNSDIQMAILVVCLGCAAALVATMTMFFHRLFEPIPLYRWGVKFGDRLTKGAVTRLTNAMDLYRNSLGTLILWMGITVVGIHLNLALVVFIISRGIGAAAKLSLLEAIFAGVFANTASILPLFPGGFGAREAVMVELLTGGGAILEQAATDIMLVYMFTVLFFNLVGGLFFIFQPKHRPLTEIVSEEI